MQRAIVFLLLCASVFGQQEPNPVTMGVRPGSRFDAKHYAVVPFSGEELLPASGKVDVVFAKDPTFSDILVYMKAVPTWPKCSGRQENNPQRPFHFENVTSDGFTLRGKKGMLIRWECTLLARKIKPS